MSIRWTPSRIDALPERGNVFREDCPSREILGHITGRWGGLILTLLQRGTLRFSELRNGIGGVTEKMLAQTLRHLERDGLVERKSYPVIPPRVEYSLTGSGREAARRLAALTRWAEEHVKDVLRCRLKHDRKKG
ncbi:MAG TPA: helix-turn-helix domain-containing protein [Thermoanaerobaculia bacterium]|nr:helix-turn-helix domain-containing protein [Thermoanaerobaculia bacterium]